MRKPAEVRRNRTAFIAVVLCLSACLARAGERQASIPIYSGSDGTRAWIEVTHTGNRSKAVPSLAIPRETVRGMSAAADAGNGLLTPAGGEGTGTAQGRADFGDFLERHKSLVVREGPEGVSLGNAFDLVGEIREAVESGKTGAEKIRAITDVLRHATPGEETLRKATSATERPVTEFALEPGDSSTRCVRCSLGGN